MLSRLTCSPGGHCGDSCVSTWMRLRCPCQGDLLSCLTSCFASSRPTGTITASLRGCLLGHEYLICLVEVRLYPSALSALVLPPLVARACPSVLCGAFPPVLRRGARCARWSALCVPCLRLRPRSPAAARCLFPCALFRVAPPLCSSSARLLLLPLVVAHWSQFVLCSYSSWRDIT